MTARDGRIMRRLSDTVVAASGRRRLQRVKMMERSMASVAFLGLGVMGYPMAGHLKKERRSRRHRLQPHHGQGREMGCRTWWRAAPQRQPKRRANRILFSAASAMTTIFASYDRPGMALRDNEERRDLYRQYDGFRRSRPRTRCGGFGCAASPFWTPRCRAARPARKTAF